MDADPWADTPTPPRGTSSEIIRDPKPEQEAGIPLDSLVIDDQPETFDSTDIPSIPSAFEVTSGTDPDGDEGGFDDFDDFDDAPIAGPSGSGGDAKEGEDAFGDFGDFEEGDFGDALGQEVGVMPIPVREEERLAALSLHPFPSTSDLVTQLSNLLSPLLEPSSSLFTSEPPRLASSSRQILPSESSRDLYVQLASPPQLKPLDWTRSRVRREHLIALGVPVNLDEVDSHRLSSLPALTISTSFGDMRPPPPRRSLDTRGKGKEREVGNGESASVPVSARPGTGGGEGKYGLGKRPELDMKRAEELCGIDEDQLSLLPPQTLKKLQDDLVKASADASALLAHLLQLKDAQTQDSSTYNGMISELIANAAKAKSAQQTGSGGVFRRSSARRPVSVVGGPGGSGHVTPRTGSPVIR